MKRTTLIGFSLMFGSLALGAESPGLECSATGSRMTLALDVEGYSVTLEQGKAKYPLASGMDCKFDKAYPVCNLARGEDAWISSLAVESEDKGVAVTVNAPEVFRYKMRGVPEIPDGITEPPPSGDAGDFNVTLKFAECKAVSFPSPIYKPRAKYNRIQIEISHKYAKENQKEVRAPLAAKFLSSAFGTQFEPLSFDAKNWTGTGFSNCLTKASCVATLQSLSQARALVDKDVKLYKKVTLKPTYVAIHGETYKRDPKKPFERGEKVRYVAYAKDVEALFTEEESTQKNMTDATDFKGKAPIDAFIKAGVIVTSYRMGTLPQPPDDKSFPLLNGIIGGYIECPGEKEICDDKLEALRKNPLVERVSLF